MLLENILVKCIIGFCLHKLAFAQGATLEGCEKVVSFVNRNEMIQGFKQLGLDMIWIHRYTVLYMLYELLVI